MSISLPRWLHFVLCVGGIYACFLFHGVLHERIYNQKWGDNKESFKYSLFLVVFQCAGNALFGLLLLLVNRLRYSSTNGTISFFSGVPQSNYCFMSATYIGSLYFTNESLQLLSFPAQTLAKSCKLIPVMLMRIVLVGQSYQLREYIHVLLITCGIGLFMLLDKKTEKKGHREESNNTQTSFIGFLYCLASLTLDGFTSPTQERVNKQFHPSMAEMMFFLNFYAVLLAFPFLYGTGELTLALSFVFRNPLILYDCAAFSLLAAAGQAVIIYTVLFFNSLVLAIVTTTRKFFSILLSVLLFGHSLNGGQWAGVSLVMTGLLLEIQHKAAGHGKEKQSKGKEA
jgi:UDP-galactose transporter B1